MDKRYVAGLFDGEGYIRISRWKKPNSTHIRYNLFSGIGMTHYPVIAALKERFGGSINQNRHDLRNSKARIQFTWCVASRAAYEFMKMIRPHSIVKADEIDIALKFQEHIDANPYTPAGLGHYRPGRDAILAYREELYQEIAALKKRSYPPLLTAGP